MKFKKGVVARILIYAIIISGLFIDISCKKTTSSKLQFEISFSLEAHSEPVTGRVYVMISKNERREPRFQVGRGVPFFGKDIKDLKPEERVIIDEDVFGYPLESIKDLPPGEYYVQGFVNIYTEFKRSDGYTIWTHNDQWEGQRWNISPGNIYSEVKKIKLDPSAGKTIKIICDDVVPPVIIPPDTKWVKRIKFQSKILTEFWGQPIFLGAVILLPEGYDSSPDMYYPANYVQGHFSLRAPYGFSSEEPGRNNPWLKRGNDFFKYWTSDACPRMIAVTFQHPCPYYDDSYAVNSENVGPYGDAIIEELILYLEEHFRIIRRPYARVLSGGSTGGWESFALQVFHPDFFGGTWSLCPDPLDFRYFQCIDIYKDKNAFFKETGWIRVPTASNRSPDGIVRLTSKQRNHMELVMGTRNRSGEQIDIFEAVFGPVGPDGYVKPLFNKKTGGIDPSVAEYWKEHFDLRYYLEKNWSWLGPKLVGKLHVYVGDMDTFYLNNAVRLLENFLEKTKHPYYEGVVEYGDGKPHCWGPRGPELIELMAKHVIKNSPDKKLTVVKNKQH